MMIGRIFPGLVGYVHNRRRKGYDFFPSCYNFFTSGRGDRSRSTVERDLERKSLKMSSKFAKTGILQGKAARPGEPRIHHGFPVKSRRQPNCLLGGAKCGK